MSTTTSTTAIPTGLTSGTWTVDASHTEASFTVRHAGISKVRGTVAVSGGSLVVGDDLERHLGLRHARPVHGVDR